MSSKFVTSSPNTEVRKEICRRFEKRNRWVHTCNSCMTCIRQTCYSYMQSIHTHDRCNQSRKTKPKQCFQARGERTTLTLVERIQKGVPVATTNVKKTPKAITLSRKLIFTRPVFVKVHQQIGIHRWCVTVTKVTGWFLVARFHWLQVAMSYQV